MKITTLITHLLLSAAVVTGSGAALPAATQATSSSPELPVQEIVHRLVQRNQERSRDLHSFTGCRLYRLEYRGFPSRKSAEMRVEVFYRAPSEKQFRVVSASGSHLVQERVFKKLLESEKKAASESNQERTALTPANYDFALAGMDTINGRRQYILSVTPRTGNKYLYRGKIWVDATDFAVSHISAQPAKDPSFWISRTDIEHVYVKVGEFWLPRHNTSVTKVRLGGTATLTIDYFNYHISNGKAGADATEKVCPSDCDKAAASTFQAPSVVGDCR